jgi:FSR family fosmidomycin resistance protein-like MFS transporter
VGSALIGFGSAVFHPESSRVARLASGGRHGFAQSTFQVGGNTGSAVGPLLAAFVVVPRGQTSVAWFAIAAVVGMVILTWVGRWYSEHRRQSANRPPVSTVLPFDRQTTLIALIVLTLLTFTKNIYMAGVSSYYTFYLIDKFGVDVQQSQLLLFLFLGASALGVFIGGPIGDKWGAKFVIWFSILGVVPFTLALPYVGLLGTAILSVIIGLILASAHPAIIVYAQSLIPGRVGMVAGLFFGLAFGVAGVGAALLGWLADRTSIEFVYHICAFLPAIGLLAAFLPEMAKPKIPAKRGKR